MFSVFNYVYTFLQVVNIRINKMCDSVLEIICKLELPLMQDKRTYGGGNCLFHAILQQGKREGVQIPFHHHSELRAHLCNFALTTTDPEILEMKTNYNRVATLAGGKSWDAFFTKMKRVGVWAEGPVLRVVAIFLRVNINVVSTSCSAKNPWLSLSGGPDVSGQALFLANDGQHFQSLVPAEDFKICIPDVVEAEISVDEEDENFINDVSAMVDVAEAEITVDEEDENFINDVSAMVDVAEAEISLIDEDENFINDVSAMVDAAEAEISLIDEDVVEITHDEVAQVAGLNDVDMGEVVRRHNMFLGRLVRLGVDAGLVHDLMACFREDEAVMGRD